MIIHIFNQARYVFILSSSRIILTLFSSNGQVYTTSEDADKAFEFLDLDNILKDKVVDSDL